MITEIKINNFKLLGMNNSIKLNKINVFYGQNATGKSSIMEALTLFIELIDGNSKNVIENGMIKTSRTQYYKWKDTKIANLISKNKASNFSILIGNDAVKYEAVFQLTSNQNLLIDHLIEVNNNQYNYPSTYNYSILSNDILDNIKSNNHNDADILRKFKQELQRTKVIINSSTTLPDYIGTDNINENYILKWLAKKSIPPDSVSELIDLIKKFKNFENITSIWAGWFEGTEISSHTIYNNTLTINLGHESFGLRRLLEILIGIVELSPEGGMILIEEPENGLSYNNLLILSKIIDETVSKSSIQFIITTHNLFLLSDFKQSSLNLYRCEKTSANEMQICRGSTEFEKLKQAINLYAQLY
ncbi:MAG: ATP-binding protein [Candidatus Nitrosocaldus sp.]